ncbi:MAG: hypothetical protein K5695_08110 [Oscillospiraceae bacterium]|nr:hypothetical protein [Oscillospiraceae bacterium]
MKKTIVMAGILSIAALAAAVITGCSSGPRSITAARYARIEMPRDAAVNVIASETVTKAAPMEAETTAAVITVSTQTVTEAHVSAPAPVVTSAEASTNAPETAATTANTASSSTESTTTEPTEPTEMTEPVDADRESATPTEPDDADQENATPTEQEETCNDGQNPVMNFIGSYSNGSAMMTVSAKGNDQAVVNVSWSSSAFETRTWEMTGNVAQIDDMLLLDYQDCVCECFVYDEDGTKLVDVYDYTDGCGCIVFSGNLLTWNDFEEGVADDQIFTYLFT